MKFTVIGKMLANRYEVLARVGEGGMAVVYRARDTLLGRMVALKVLRPQYASDVDFVERFRREAQTAASLSHPNVVNIYDVGEEGGIYYIVMEYVEGRNLKEIIRQEGPLPNRTAIFIAREICRALEAAHRLNLTHRDVKPHNILITFDGRVKVTDFGIARAAATSSLTQTGTVIGSVHYFSPEQARGEPVGTSSDIYSLGVLCYEMVTGAVPFTGDSPVSIALKHLQEQPKPPRQINPAIPVEFERIILQAMAKSETQRYPSATAMLRDLRNLGEEYDTAANDEDITQPMTPVELPDATMIKAGSVLDDKSIRQGVRRAKKKRGRVWLWLVVFVSFLGGLLWAGGALPDVVFTEEVSVPSVVGKDVREAEAILKEAGLVLAKDKTIASSTISVNRIISQDPPANRRVRLGRTIFVTISKGPDYVPVPDVIGLSLNDAQKRLNSAGLGPGTVIEELKPGSPDNIVLRQDPAAGSRMERDGRVNLVVSGTGPQAKKVSVPDLRDLTVDAAKIRITDLGLKVGNVYSEPDPSATPGSVTDQNPPPGTEVSVGSVVDFVYAPKETNTSGPKLLTANPRSNTIEREVTVNIPEGPEVEVWIELEDDFGSRWLFKGLKPGGSQYTWSVTARGAKPVVRVYFNGKVVQEVPLK